MLTFIHSRCENFSDESSDDDAIRQGIPTFRGTDLMIVKEEEQFKVEDEIHAIDISDEEVNETANLQPPSDESDDDDPPEEVSVSKIEQEQMLRDHEATEVVADIKTDLEERRSVATLRGIEPQRSHYTEYPVAPDFTFRVPKRPRRESSLLEKLLAKDIAAERSELLQCVKYVVANNFFGVGKLS